MLKAVIVDDEEWILKEITDLVQESGFIRVAKAYSSPGAMLEELEQTKPDAAFIDIEMPGMDGITLAEKLLERQPFIRIVFITAYNQYAVKAFELNALDYILKPVNHQRFQKMLARIAASIPREGRVEGDLVISCFGQLEVLMGGKRVKWERSKAEELFAYLLMHHGYGVHKEVILEELWPDYDPRRAIPILQTSVCKLRNIFAPMGDMVELDYSSNRYSLTISNCHCDLFEVEAALESAPGSLEQIARLVGKGFLSQQGYLWAMAKEEELRNRLEQVLRARVQQASSGGNNASVLRELKALLTFQPYDEDANNQVLTCYARAGDRSGMAEHYKWLEEVLAQDYDMDPPPSTQRVFNKLSEELQ